MPELEEGSRRVTEEAAAWMARLRAEYRTESDVRAFQEWFAADIAHFNAFEHISELWEAAGPRYIGERGPQKTAVLLNRRNLVAGLGAMFFVGSGVGFWQSAQARTFVTEVGEQKHVVLDDGTRVFLDTDTCCTVKFTDSARLVNLQYGRANFRVLPDGARPFAVEAADLQIRTLQSQFDVRSDRSSNNLSITLIQGRALMERRNASRQIETKVIVAGEQAVAGPSTGTVITKADIVRMLAWHRGQANFENTRLDFAVSEMNRYSTSKIALGPGISDLRISGVYSFGDNNAFAGAAAQVLPIRMTVDRERAGILLTAENNKT